MPLYKIVDPLAPRPVQNRASEDKAESCAGGVGRLSQGLDPTGDTCLVAQLSTPNFYKLIGCAKIKGRTIIAVKRVPLSTQCLACKSHG